MKIKGMLVSVVKTTLGDCTNNGITSRLDSFILTGLGMAEVFERDVETQSDEILVLKKREFGGKVYLYAVPYVLKDRHTMMGGNFVYTSDSRFREINQYPIPVHDRIEN